MSSRAVLRIGGWDGARRARVALGAVGGLAVAIAVLTTLGSIGGGAATHASPTSHVLSTVGKGDTAPPATSNAVYAAAQSVDATTTSSALTLGINAAPSAICANGVLACSAGAAVARVTLSAEANGVGTVSWPAVQVAFVVETTLYDGVYDPASLEPGTDPCAGGGSSSIACEESNGVPFFMANAQTIAEEIQSANPHTTVSFALVDYFAAITDWDDGDGAEYHVDIPQFIPADEFGSAVKESFDQEVMQGNWFYNDADFADNFLHSSSITALYGTIIGSGLNWANDTHHVIVWLGSSAPRDPGYPEDYCVSGHNSATNPIGSCYGQTCEPAYRFPSGSSPGCEGWIRSQDGNDTHSIVALTKTAPQCTQSVGGDCTVDIIDYWDTPTDPYSKGWPAVTGGGPGSEPVLKNSENIIAAGCDMAAATGGSWSGPAWANCPNGATGDLQYVEHGSYTNPTTTNPTLLDALRIISFGPVTETQVAAGTGQPIFTFVPYGNIQLAPSLQPQANCLRAGEIYHLCQGAPSILHAGPLTYLGWNWSINKSANIMYVGDSWSASFNIVDNGPPYTLVPVDACITVYCKAGGSQAVDNLYTWASYVPASNNTIDVQSFPIAQVRVQLSAAAPPGGAPPPPPPAPPGIAIPTPPALPVVNQVGISNTVGVAQVSLQAAAAGFLGAGFMRVGIKNRPIAMRVAAKSGTITSKFDAASREGAGGLGRFE